MRGFIRKIFESAADERHIEWVIQKANYLACNLKTVKVLEIKVVYQGWLQIWHDKVRRWMKVEVRDA